MKILFCTNCFDSTHNGTGQFAQHLFRLNEAFPRHEMRVLSEDVTEAKKLFPNMFYQLTVWYPFFLKPLSVVLRAFNYHHRAIKVKESYQYDIIFYNNIFGAWWSAIMFTDKTKVVSFIHDYSFIHYGPRSFKLSKGWLYRFFHHLAERISANLVDIIFSNSDYLKKEIETMYKVKPQKVKKLYVAIDINQIDYRKPLLIETGETISIVFVKNDYNRGGLVDLINAVNELSQKYRFKITVIGPYITKKPIIENLFNKTNIILNFRGNLKQAEVFQAYYTHHILCVPAKSEALGVTNMEGLAHGIPVVTTNVGGIPEVTDGNRCAWISEASNPKNLASTIRRCIESPAERLEKSLAGRKHVEIHFNYHQMLTKTVTILENLLC